MTTPPGIVETKLFTRIWDHFGLSVDDLIEMQNECLLRRKSAPLIAGCAGARKMRFAPFSIAGGKRGGMRVIFKYFESHSLIVMILAYPKNAKENITNDDKNSIVMAISTIELELQKRYIQGTSE